MKYNFGNCTLDSDVRELRVGGNAVELEPQVFDVLQFLLERRDRVVARDELMEAVWAGRVVSDATIDARISAARKAVGDSGKSQSIIRTIPKRGFRFVGEIVTPTTRVSAPESQRMTGSIRFCTSTDGTRIAFQCSGGGPPLLRAGHWLTHLEHDWHCPIWEPYLSELSRHYSLVRYDQRGCGVSDWSVADLSLDAFVADCKAVADAAELERFAIVASSQAVPVAVAFATRFPQRVTSLVLQGGFVQGRRLRSNDEERQKTAAFLTLMQQGWGVEGSPYLQAFSSLYVPDCSPEMLEALAHQQSISTSAQNAVALRQAFDSFDVTDLLDQVETPTLVVHARNDAIQPLQQGRELAARIKGGRLLILESRNHVLVPHDPAWSVFINALREHVPG